MLYFSIEFDRDCDHFAIAGVTKKIKVTFFSSLKMNECAIVSLTYSGKKVSLLCKLNVF